MTLYNEIETYAAQWLRNLSAAGHIAEGQVDERSIKELNPADLAGHGQCHFFAGIGVWSYALRLAGWPDDLPVWTGSCPCQPFSSAGKGLGFDDERHLWPTWFELIRECRPPVIFGEQVASKDGLAWLDLVSSDLEGCGYAFGAAVLPAAGFGAPHQRHRIFFVANSDSSERRRFATGEGRIGNGTAPRRQQGNGEPQCGVATGDLAHADSKRDADQRPGAVGGTPPPLQGADREWKRIRTDSRKCGDDVPGSMADDEQGLCQQRECGLPQDGNAQSREYADGCCASGVVADAQSERQSHRGPGAVLSISGCGGGASGVTLCDAHIQRLEGRGLQSGERAGQCVAGTPGPTNGFWSDCEWLPCRDGKARPVEPGLEPLAYGTSGRVVIRRARIQGGAEVQEAHWYSRCGALKGLGNAIVAEVAAQFIAAAMEAM